MAVALEMVVKQLTDSGIVAQGKLENFVPPKAHPASVEELVAQLVKNSHLTPFQAQQVKAGKAKALILGEYTILDKIGAGGMGQVFKALHRRMERIVAIKMLPPSMTKNVAALARFQREVVAAAKLHHPHIVTAHDAGQANGVHFLVMEHVAGQDLSVLVKKTGPIPVAKVVNYVLQAAQGLEFAHKKGVIHRDIKPANLLLDSEGVVKILDMGLARIESDADAPTRTELTGTGAVMGTVDYMAPEQAMSTKNADARADIYSLGCSLFYLLTGKPTFEGETVTAKLIGHQSQPIPDLRKCCPEATPELEAVFHKMMAKKVADRYQTMADLIADLEQLNVGQQTSTTLQTTLQPSANTNLENSALSFLKSIPPPLTKPKPKTKPGKPGSSVKIAAANHGKRPPWKNVKVLIGAAVVGVLILAGIIGSLLAPVKPEPKAIASNAEDADRRAAESVLSNQGKVTIVVNGQEYSAKAVGELPAVSFYVKVVDLSNTDVRDDELEPIASLRQVEWVNLVNTKVGNTGLRHLVDLPGLTTLWLKETNVTDAGLTDLIRLNSLTYLGLNGTRITDEGLAEIAKLTALTGLDLRNTEVTASGLSQLRKALPKCRIEWTDLGNVVPTPATTVGPTPPLAKAPFAAAPAKAITDFNSPAFLAWVAQVQAMPAEEQLQAVSKKLIELNPGFDGKLVGDNGVSPPRIENGVITELKFFTDNVTDITPVRALPGLRLLRCHGSGLGKGALSDLRPLTGMQLTNLQCGWTEIADLTPLVGMPLTNLVVLGARISDLSPLRGMPLESLRCGTNQISDLTPLAECKSLQSLEVNLTNVTAADVSELQKALPNCKIKSR